MKVQRLDKVISASGVGDEMSTSARILIIFYQELNVNI